MRCVQVRNATTAPPCVSAYPPLTLSLRSRSFDLMADKSRWEEALHKAVGEICRLGKFGVTTDEMLRYGGALLTDAEQVAAQGDRISHADQLSYLMESVACGHTFMSPTQSYEMTDRALSELTLEVSAPYNRPSA